MQWFSPDFPSADNRIVLPARFTVTAAPNLKEFDIFSPAERERERKKRIKTSAVPGVSRCVRFFFGGRKGPDLTASRLIDFWHFPVSRYMGRVNFCQRKQKCLRVAIVVEGKLLVFPGNISSHLNLSGFSRDGTSVINR